MRHSKSADRRRGGAVRARSGFSLLELLLVVTLLGILIVTTLPRFLERQTGSDVAYLERLAGELEAGAALFHARWIAAGRPAANTVLPDFAPLRTNAEGYPYGSDDHGFSGQGLTTAEDCAALFRGLLGDLAPSVVAAPGPMAESGEEPPAAEFTAVVAGPDCHYFLTRDGSAGELSMVRYRASQGRTELQHQVTLAGVPD